MNIRACDHQSKYTCEQVIIKASTHVSMLSTKHVNIQAHENFNIEGHIHLTVQSLWSLRTSIQLHSFIKAYENDGVGACDH